jgi:AcrR family transcriptional regulator
MARKPAPGARNRILDTASRLFREQGVHPVGLQQIVDECGCGKNLLYRNFASKDDLVVAYLRRCRTQWEAIIGRAIEQAGPGAAGQLVAVVGAVAGQVRDADYHGCPFLNTHGEFRDPGHPAHQVSAEHFDALRSQLHAIAAQGGFADPRAVAEKILLIIYGLYATAAVLGAHDTAPNAVALAEDTVQAGKFPAAAGRHGTAIPAIRT